MSSWTWRGPSSPSTEQEHQRKGEMLDQRYFSQMLKPQTCIKNWLADVTMWFHVCELPSRLFYKPKISLEVSTDNPFEATLPKCYSGSDFHPLLVIETLSSNGPQLEAPLNMCVLSVTWLSKVTCHQTWAQCHTLTRLREITGSLSCPVLLGYECVYTSCPDTHKQIRNKSSKECVGVFSGECYGSDLRCLNFLVLQPMRLKTFP